MVWVEAAVMIGKGLTITESMTLAVHPVEVTLPVIVYTVVTVGFAVTTAPVDALNPVEGDHV